MKKVKPYSEYKNSQQEWLGHLPYHWKVVRTKHLFDLITEPAPKGNSMELLSIYTALGVKPRKELEERGNKASTTDGYWMVEKGDIIVNKLLAWMGAIGISEYDGVTSPAYDLLRHRENVNPYFYNYLFRNPISSREFKRHSRGIMDMRLRLYFTRFGDIKLPFPSIEEQNKIVHFLDHKLEKINRFISKKKQLIELLKEKKAAVINQAVTKGLDPNVKMKDSGIEWLGEIPEECGVKRLKYVCYLQRGHDLSKEKFIKGEIPVYGSNGIIGFHNEKTTDAPCITIGRSGSVGKVNFISEDFWAHNTALYVKRSFGNNWEYLFFLLKSIDIAMVGNGSAVPTLDRKNVHQLPVAYPPIIEQDLIVKFIKRESKKINKTITTIQKEITLVEEYKTALIAEAVTGKIDVREWEEK